MMRVLVTAATKYDATTEIAQAITETLGEHPLEDRAAAQPATPAQSPERHTWTPQNYALARMGAASLATRSGSATASIWTILPSATVKAFRLPEDLDTTYDYLIGMLTTGVGQIDASR
jgi:hypothetical protein